MMRRMGKFTDLTDRRNTRAVVLRRAEKDKRGVCWWIRCDCGVEKVVTAAMFVAGHVKSCGCLHEELLKAGIARTHGLTDTPEYVSWRAMKWRCTNPNASDYDFYGGRGITICSEWRYSFESFLAHIGPMPQPGLTVERIDNTNGSYEPGNVRWATRMEQGANRRDNVYLTAFGLRLHVAEWGRRTGIPYRTIFRRLRRGMTHEEALTAPRIPKGKLTHGDVLAIRSRLDAGETGRAIAQSLDVSENTVYRISAGRAHRNVR